MAKFTNFCQNPSVETLEKMDVHASNYLLRICLQIHSGSWEGLAPWIQPSELKPQELVLLVLKYFRIRNMPLLEPISEDEAELYLERFSVALSGARAGDTLIGVANVTRGAVMKIHYEDVLPNWETVGSLQAHPQSFKQFLEKMRLFAPFRKMGTKEVEEWYKKYSNVRKAFIGEDGRNIRLELIQPGESNFAKLLSKDNLEQLMSGRNFTAKEIEDMFPRKPGSRALHPTLVFIKSWWKVVIDYKKAETFEGTCIDLNTGKVLDGFEGKEKKSVIIIEDVGAVEGGELGFITGPMPAQIDRGYLQGVMGQVLEKSVEDIAEQYEKIILNFKNFSPSSYKSLLQKTIRFRARQVKLMDGVFIETDLFLLVVLSELILHPGAFVPDIQRFVSGIESATKRLAVTIFEDSSFAKEGEAVMLLGAALLCQRYKNFKPNRLLIKKWFGIAVGALKSEKVYAWKIEEKCGDYTVVSKNSAFRNASALLDEVKSFASDLNMVSYLARYKYRHKPPPGFETPQAGFMPVWHAVDFHCAPDIAYYFDADFPYFEGNSFHDFYQDIFHYVSGQNPRAEYKEDFKGFEGRDWVKETRKAQLRFLTSRQGELKQREKVKNKSYVLRETLNEGWLAGLVGAISVRNFYVTLRYDDPYSLAVAKKPTRDTKSSFISDDEQEKIIQEAKTILRNGISLNQSALPSEDFRGTKVFLQEGEYFIKTGKLLIPWNDFRNIRVKIPFHEPLEGDFWTALQYEGRGLVKGAWEGLKEILNETEIPTLRRVLMYIASYDTEIELNHLNIKGGALHLGVNDKDIHAYQFLLKLSMIFPGAFSPKKYASVTFRVHTPLLFWRVRSRIISFVKAQEKEDVSGWEKYGKKGFKDNEERKAWEHQVSSLEEMKENFKLGSRGHFIYLAVGSGKTFLVMTYISYLYRIGKLPPYIIYTLPSSAIQSVAHEIKSFGLKVNLHIPLKNIKNRKIATGVTVKQNADFEPFTVSLIEHDHLRRARNELVECSAKSITIVDEVHKVLNDSQRTSAAVEISYLSSQFICMSGTPILDNKIYKLIFWLKPLVPFPLTEKNFWTALNSIICRLFSTGIKTNHEDILVFFNREEERAYQKLVGPSIGGFNKNVTYGDIREAIELCYKTVTREMVKKTIELVEGGNGVMLVAQNKSHQLELYEKLGKSIKKRDIYILEKGGSIFLTDQSVERGDRDFKVVIPTIRQSEGYSLTRLNSFVSSVYFSNQANRSQLEGRINRIGSKAKSIDYFYFHCGILSYIHRKYKEVNGLKLSIDSMMKMMNS